jgi:hypothetical protein
MLTDMCRSKIRKEWRLIAHTNGNGVKHKEVKISEGYRRGPGTFPDPEYSALDELASETFYREQTRADESRPNRRDLAGFRTRYISTQRAVVALL